MSENTVNKGGRPAVGPAISVAYPEELLREVDAAANRERVRRAQWLRQAASDALPYEGLGSARELRGVLAELSDQLVSQRDNAQDPDEDREYRELAGIAYAEQVHTLRTTLQEAARALPIAEVEQQLEGQASEEGAARVEGQLGGLVAARAILEALSQMLPLDAHHVRDRASLDDPRQDVDA